MKGLSRGLLRGYKPSDGPSLQALVATNRPEPLEARLGHDEHEQQHGHDPAPVHVGDVPSEGRHARRVRCDGNGFQVIVKW